MKGPNFRSVKESSVKLGPNEQNQNGKSNRKKSLDKRPLEKKKVGGIDSFFASCINKTQTVKDEKETIRSKNREIFEKAMKEPEKDVSISWEDKSVDSIFKGGSMGFKEIEEYLRILETEGVGAGIRIWEGFFDSVRKLIKEVQELKIKVMELSKVVSQVESSEDIKKNLVEEVKFEEDKKAKQREERIKAYKEAGTWLEPNQWNLLNDGQKALKRFRFSDKHQNMNPIQFGQLNNEEKEYFILSKLQWRSVRRKELMELMNKEEEKYQAERSLKDLEYFNGRYFDYKRKRWKRIRLKELLHERIDYEKNSRSWNGSSDPYYL